MHHLFTPLCLALCVLLAGTFTSETQAWELPDETYYLVNHPDGNFNPEGEAPIYGMVLSDFAGKDRILFDFDHPKADMKLKLTRTGKIKIFGVAMGRELKNDVWKTTNKWKINFVYSKKRSVESDGGVDDTVVESDGRNSGWVRDMNSGNTYDLIDMMNEDGISFTLGDGDGSGIRVPGNTSYFENNPMISSDFGGLGDSQWNPDDGDPPPQPVTPLVGEGWLAGAEEDVPPIGKPSDFIFVIGGFRGKKPNLGDI